MSFPFYIFHIHPHVFFEILGMFLGVRLYFWMRQKNRVEGEQNFIIIICMILFSFVFSRLLHIIQEPQNFGEIFLSPAYFFTTGKTIIGALLGGILGVEIGKKIMYVTTRTGDDFVFPFLLALIIGRLGCFFTGLEDNTYGIATSLPWGVDFGDGILRHPTQIYEIVYLFLMGLCLYFLKKSYKLPNGLLFQLMVIDYLTFRFFIDFIKPYPRHYLMLNSLQWACIIGIIYYIFVIKDTVKKEGITI